MKQKNKYIAVCLLVLVLGFGLSIYSHTYADQCSAGQIPDGQGGCKASDGTQCGTGQVPDGKGGCVNGNGCPPGQSGTPPNCVLTNPAPGQLVNESDFGALLAKFIQILLMFAGAIAVIFLIIGGFQYVMSRGNEETMEKAKKTIQSAIIGIVIIVMAFAIVLIINSILTKPASEQGKTTYQFTRSVL